MPDEKKITIGGLYPEAEGYRGGAKVAWLYYNDEETAKKAAEIATKEANRKERQGYDFGFQSPGSINKMPDIAKGGLEKFASMYEVCIP